MTEKRRIRQAKYYREKQLRLRKEIVTTLGGRCVSCGFDDFRALHIDHKVGGQGTQERLKWGGGYYKKVLDLVRAGTDKYQVLCANCNQIKKVVNKETNRKY